MFFDTEIQDTQGEVAYLTALIGGVAGALNEVSQLLPHAAVLLPSVVSVIAILLKTLRDRRRLELNSELQALRLQVETIRASCECPYLIDHHSSERPN